MSLEEISQFINQIFLSDKPQNIQLLLSLAQINLIQRRQFEYMFEEESVREESIQLLKEQNLKLKIQTKELELKDDQMKFLKQTILALEQQKDTLAHQNHSLKQKLKTMANQISNYNTTVVHKIYEENQNLNLTIAQQIQQIQKFKQECSSSTSKIKQLQKQIDKQNREQDQLSKSCQQLKNWKKKAQKKLQLLEKESKQLQTKNIALQRQIDDGNNQTTYFSQQIDILSQKHQQAVKGAEKKLKQTVQKMIGKQELARSQAQIKELLIKNKHLKTQIDKMSKDNDKLRFEAVSFKEKLLNYQVKEETQSFQLRLDFTNLMQSIKIGKKISEFQSSQHEKALQIYTTWRDSQDKLQKYEQFQFLQQKKLKGKQSQLKIALEQIKTLQQKLNAQKQHQNQQYQLLQASYQNTVMQLNLKLKKQEIASSSLKFQQEEIERIKQQNQKERQGYQQEKSVLISTMEQLKKENALLSDELGLAVRLCQQNIVNRQCITHYKYILQEILAVVYYLHGLILNNKLKIKYHYLPFITYFFEACRLLQNKKRQPMKGINKFRVCVWAVRCLVRMRSQGAKGRGLQRHAANAVEKRMKIQNLSSHIENVSKCILKGGTIFDVIKCSNDIYRWKRQPLHQIYLKPFAQKKRISSQLQLNYEEQNE